MMTLAAASPTQDFYQERLRAGKDAYRQKRFVAAAAELRVAAFGLLDTPPLLSEALARLALAQAAAGRAADAAATLSRFVDVERRFGSYAKAALGPEVRSEFQQLLVQHVPPATLQSVAGLAGFVETEAQKAAKLPPRERRKALEAGFEREPNNAAWAAALAQDAAERRDENDVLRWTGRALRIAPANPEALALEAHVRVARRQCAEALADLKALPVAELERRPQLQADRFVCLVETGDWAGAEAASKTLSADATARPDVSRASQRLATALAARRPTRTAGRGEGAPAPSSSVSAPALARSAGATRSAIAGPGSRAAAALSESRRLMDALKAPEAAKILLEALRSDPDNRELRVALLEACCLSGDWRRGAEQVAFVAPFSEREALPMFYAAVVLYQTGKIQEARGYMERVRPRVSGPLAEEYARKILGNS